MVALSSSPTWVVPRRVNRMLDNFHRMVKEEKNQLIIIKTKQT